MRGVCIFDQKRIDNTSDEDLEQIQVSPIIPIPKPFVIPTTIFKTGMFWQTGRWENSFTIWSKRGLWRTPLFSILVIMEVLPRSKGYAYESGLQVPLVVYVRKMETPLSPQQRIKGKDLRRVCRLGPHSTFFGRGFSSRGH